MTLQQIANYAKVIKDLEEQDFLFINWDRMTTYKLYNIMRMNMFADIGIEYPPEDWGELVGEIVEALSYHHDGDLFEAIPPATVGAPKNEHVSFWDSNQHFTIFNEIEIQDDGTYEERTTYQGGF